MIFIFLSALAVTHLTRGIDGRMTLVLVGISRLEAAHLVRCHYNMELIYLQQM